jgi:GTP-binding protein YchF
VEFVDIAGLVRGASKGEGRGNQFLMHIRQVDAIIHVVRCFKDVNIAHVEVDIEPVRDISIIKAELLIADIDVLERALQKISKTAKSGKEADIKRVKLIGELLESASNGEEVRSFVANRPEHAAIAEEYRLITAKPLLYVANIAEDNNMEYTASVKEAAKRDCAKLLTICGKLEAELSELSDVEAKEYLKSLGIEHSGLENLIFNGYDLLSLVTFFTAGEKEVRAWTIPKDTTAKAAAGKIHTDIERGFIRAEVLSYSDFVELKSLQIAKEKGRLRLEGREYIVKDGDIIYFRHNA